MITFYSNTFSGTLGSEPYTTLYHCPEPALSGSAINLSLDCVRFAWHMQWGLPF